MKTVVVYDLPYEGSFCHAILESVVEGQTDNGNEVDVIDLHKDEFNPVMSGKDLLGFVKHEMVDEQAADYVQRIKEADHLVLVFPIWWELMPAMTKGFIDKIIFPGSTYTYTKSGYGMNTMLDNLQSATVITTMNTPRVLYKSLVKRYV
ncbi:NAD(P)H-dependent oxidoreductase [Mollicutes bacterium LVI A0078]|nr:NAD(P)H-dependent oxidoreductase [Mollicutes bacterium LVI A0075]WOO90460.1 NAD(P)H-dependent oxidoreductase [Mollicutes bacterium LVI A0078]